MLNLVFCTAPPVPVPVTNLPVATCRAQCFAPANYEKFSTFTKLLCKFIFLKIGSIFKLFFYISKYWWFWNIFEKSSSDFQKNSHSNVWWFFHNYSFFPPFWAILHLPFLYIYKSTLVIFKKVFFLYFCIFPLEQIFSTCEFLIIINFSPPCLSHLKKWFDPVCSFKIWLLRVWTCYVLLCKILES